MTNDTSKVEKDRQILVKARERGPISTLAAFTRLSGPGWLQSAITLGGGSLASSLYLGVVAGVALLWIQPVAMILGIIMLSGIAYVTLSTSERPFDAINRHVSPVLGWSWALAALAANMFWCLPQYSLANGVLEQNLLPEILGSGGSLQASVAVVFGDDSWWTLNASKLLVVSTILVVSTLITWSYDSGRWGIKLYEWLLKGMVAGIVLCFFGVVWALRGELDWGAIGWGFLPDLTKLFEPSDPFIQVLAGSAHRELWHDIIVLEQREILISAAATAVGINMTFLFPYSLLAKGWGREFRGLAVFDLGTGMLIPFVLATSCVVVAAASQFHTRPVEGFLGETREDGTPVEPTATQRTEFYSLLTPVIQEELGEEEYTRLTAAEEPLEAMLATIEPSERARMSEESIETIRTELGRVAVEERIDQLPESDRRIAAMLIKRSPFDLAQALRPLTDERVANLIFGLGVLGMTLSTITLLMLISGFVICEIFGFPQGGWQHRFGCLAAATGVLGPFIWSRASFYLAVYVSVFGMMLLPLAYLSFLLLMNRPSLLGDAMPRGGKRWTWNLLLGLSAVVATVASLYSVWQRTAWNGIIAIIALIVLAALVQLVRLMTSSNSPRPEPPARGGAPPA